MASPESTEEILLKWVNLFPLDSKVESVADLSDGLVFARMLEDIDPEYAVKDVATSTIPSKWLRRKKALETVYRSLLRYLRNHSQYNPAELEEPVDIDAIAENEDVQQTTELIVLFLIAAVLGTVPNQTKYANRMENMFDEASAARIKELVAQKFHNQPEAVLSDSTITTAHIPSKISKDLDLALEEECANLQSELADLKKKHADYITRFDNLDYNHDILKARNTAAEAELEKLRGLQDDDEAKIVIRNLQHSLQETNDVVANLEQQLEDNRHQKSEIDSLRADAKRADRLDDEVRELKNENALLSRKANKADHFEKKIESLKSIQSENERLKEHNEVLMANMKDWDQMHTDLSKSQNAVEKYQKMHGSQEVHIVELERRIKIYQQDIGKQSDEIEMLRMQKENEERFYADRIEEMKAGHNRDPDSPIATKHLTLDEELEQSGDATPNYPLEISRLQAEIQLLKSTAGGTTNSSLRIDLEEVERVKRDLENRYQKLTEKNALIEQQLSAMIGNSSGEKDQAIQATRRLYLEADDALSAAKNEVRQLQIDVSTRDRELLSLKADLAAIDQEEIDQLEDLKTVNNLVTTSLQNDLVLLQDKHKALTAELEQKKTHLLETILNNNRLLNEMSAGKNKSDAADDDEAGKARARLIVEEEKKNRADYESTQEQIKKYESTIQDLQRKLKAAEEASPDAQKAANEAIIKNLTRENALISTAWYDLTSRLQSNHVVLQRRQDAPKSWLNRQRQLVNATPRR